MDIPSLLNPMAPPPTTPTMATRLCDSCKRIAIDDLSAGGFECLTEDGTPHLAFRYKSFRHQWINTQNYEQSEMYDRGLDYRRKMIKTGYVFDDSLPLLPRLAESAVQVPCDFCGWLREAILKTTISPCDTDTRIRLWIDYAWGEGYYFLPKSGLHRLRVSIRYLPGNASDAFDGIQYIDDIGDTHCLDDRFANHIVLFNIDSDLGMISILMNSLAMTLHYLTLSKPYTRIL